MPRKNPHSADLKALYKNMEKEGYIREPIITLIESDFANTKAPISAMVFHRRLKGVTTNIIVKPSKETGTTFKEMVDYITNEWYGMSGNIYTISLIRGQSDHNTEKFD